ncbi:CDP-glycerol glycerophosphotransferase family protein [Cetobacterium sp.]|uniref:CDP-glycerol glycerophosphotransferase family protein n=1 Tax=Cetobacterium sp. TaxID=2071632 RepID=UPI003F366716
MDKRLENNIKRGIYFIKGFLISLIYIYIPRKKNRIIFNSTKNEDFDFNSKYLFEYFLKNLEDEYEVRYVINDTLKKKELEKKYGLFFIETNSLKGMIYALNAEVWITSTLETPVGGILLNKNRMVYHVGHGTPLKNIGLLEKNISIIKRIYYLLIKNNFTYVLATSENFKKIMAKFLNISEDKVVVLGQPRNDLLYKSKKITKNKKVLYAPTWRPWGDVKLFPFKDFKIEKLEKFLEENSIDMYIRVHPNFEDKIPRNLLNIKNIEKMSSKEVPEIMEELSQFDLLITDYSSIYIDYLILDRPIIFLPYDYTQYESKIGFTVNYQKYTPGVKPKLMEEFLEVLKKSLNDKNFYSKERIESFKLFNKYKKNNLKMNFDFIMGEIRR